MESQRICPKLMQRTPAIRYSLDYLSTYRPDNYSDNEAELQNGNPTPG
jgi:hypothetical protein